MSRIYSYGCEEFLFSSVQLNKIGRCGKITLTSEQLEKLRLITQEYIEEYTHASRSPDLKTVRDKFEEVIPIVSMLIDIKPDLDIVSQAMMGRVWRRIAQYKPHFVLDHKGGKAYLTDMVRMFEEAQTLLNEEILSIKGGRYVDKCKLLFLSQLAGIHVECDGNPKLRESFIIEVVKCLPSLVRPNVPKGVGSINRIISRYNNSADGQDSG